MPENIKQAKELLTKLTKHCVGRMENTAYSNLSKLPYMVMAFVNAMNWRMKECAEAALMLLETDLTHPSLMLIRGTMENAAITIRLADVVQEVVSKEAIEEGIDEMLMRVFFGNNYRKDEPFTDPDDERLKAERIGKHIKRAEELYPGFQRNYSCLCELVHPNYDGVSQSFSFLNIEEGYTTFGPQLKTSHDLYEAFTSTIVLALTVYLDQIKLINDNLQDFINLCDIDIMKEYLQ